MISKVYEHSFMNVVLEYDETKPETDIEKELITHYLDFLNKLGQKSDLMSDLRNRFFELRILEEDSLPVLNEEIKTYDLLLKRARELQDSSTNIMSEYDELLKEMCVAGDNVVRHDDEVVEKIRKLVNSNQADFEILFNWFENEQEIYKAYDKFTDFKYKYDLNNDACSLNYSSFDKSIEAMKEAMTRTCTEWDAFFEIRLNLVKTSLGYNEKIAELNKVCSAVQELMELLRAGKYAVKTINFSAIKGCLIHFRFLKKELFGATDSGMKNPEAQFRIDFDLERPAPGLYIFNLDAHVFVHQEVTFQVRTSFYIPAGKEELQRIDLLTYLVDHGFKNAYECAGQLYKTEKKSFDWSSFKMPAESRSFLIDNLNERMLNIDDSELEQIGYYSICHTFNGSLLERVTILIINELLYNYKAFSCNHNQKVFHEFISLPVYVTIRCKVDQASPQTQQPVDLRHVLAFLLCVECASQILTGDHLSSLEPMFKENKFDETIIKTYLREAEGFIKNFLSDLNKKDSHFVDLEEEYRDWNSLIK